MRTVRQFTGDLADALIYHAQEAASISADPRLSELRLELAVARKAKRTQALDAYTLRKVTKAVRGIWGDEQDPSLPLQGGSYWYEREQAAAALRQAKTKAASHVDYARLGIEIARVPERLRDVPNVREAQILYNGSDDYGQLALETHAEAVRRQFPSDPLIGGFLGELKTRRAERFRTPEVVEAEKRAEAAQQDGVTAYKLTRQTAATLGVAGPFQAAGAGAVLAQVQADLTVDGARGTEHWTFSKRGPRVLSRAAEPLGGSQP